MREIVETVDLELATAKVVVRVGNNLFESAITHQSVEELKIAVGSEVTPIINSHRGDGGLNPCASTAVGRNVGVLIIERRQRFASFTLSGAKALS